MRRMGRVLAAVVTLALVGAGALHAAPFERLVSAGAVSVRVPDDWSRVAPAVASVSDPRTVLVVGTRGVAARDSECQVSSYRVPADGAAVVVVGWRGQAPEGLPRDRSELQAMRLRRPLFECFDGRGAVAQIVLRGRAYQVSIMVGDRAGRETLAAAYAVARSFGLAP